MSRVSHHPDDSLLAGFASGTLRPGFDLPIGAHLERCARCRGAVSDFEAAAGALLLNAEPAALDHEAFDRALARIELPQSAAPASLEAAFARESAPLLGRLALKRRRIVAPGIWVQSIDTPHLAGDRVYLLNVAPGAPSLRHGHEGEELTCVISGALVDAGERYGPGDFCHREGRDPHRPGVEPGEPCLCIVATRGRLAAKGFIGRLALAYADI